MAEAALPLQRLTEQLRERRTAISSLQASQGAEASARSVSEVCTLCNLVCRG